MFSYRFTKACKSKDIAGGHRVRSQLDKATVCSCCARAIPSNDLARFAVMCTACLTMIDVYCDPSWLARGPDGWFCTKCKTWG